MSLVGGQLQLGLEQAARDSFTHFDVPSQAHIGQCTSARLVLTLGRYIGGRK